jgi:hypothetical protein
MVLSNIITGPPGTPRPGKKICVVEYRASDLTIRHGMTQTKKTTAERDSPITKFRFNQ